MSNHQPLWIDHGYDREHSAAGSSRYGEHVRQRGGDFSDAWGDIAPVTFACTAWRIGVPPALSPGYVRWHRRILSATCHRNQWDGTLTARVRLVSPWPAALAWPREWWRDRGWRDWPEMFGQFVQPTERDLTRAPHLRASLLVEAPLPLSGLPAAPDGPRDDTEETARRAVTVLVRELNELLTPVIRQLECGQPPSSRG
jgi:hypothetical protein